METIVKNIFKVGPQVSGESFIGRKVWIRKMTEDLFDSKCAISLVGPTRIGKSSLVRQVLAENAHRTDRMVIRMCMGEMKNAVMFWNELIEQLREGIEDADLWDEKLEKLYNELYMIDQDNAIWPTVFRRVCRRVFSCLMKAGVQVLLVIDEFDAVVQVFGETVADYQLLRSLYSEPDKYCLNGVLISRRTLKFMEQKVQSLSTLHGVFAKETLDEFNDADMEEYYSVLEKSGITLTEDGKEQLLYYTGANPYLCSIFGQRLVASQRGCANSQVIREIYQERKGSIMEYYEDLIERLTEDNHLEALIYLSLGSMQHLVSRGDLDNMRSLGVLRYDDFIGHYAYSADFMKYLKTKPLNIPHWQLLSGAEKALKALMARLCPRLSEISDISGAAGLVNRMELEKAYSWLKPQWAGLEQSIAALSDHMQAPTVLDAMSLPQVITAILADWEKLFCHSFGSDGEWKAKLQLIRDLSSPLTGANEQYVTKDKLATCCQYCQQLIQMNF